MHAALGSADSVLQSDTNSQTSATTHSLSLFSLSLLSLSLSLSLSLLLCHSTKASVNRNGRCSLIYTLSLSLSDTL